jgi:hypothetical protein
VKRGWSVVGVGAVTFALVARCSKEQPPAREPLRFATFNVEDFPKDRRQIAGAFDEMADLQSVIIGSRRSASRIGRPRDPARATDHCPVVVTFE